MVQCKSKDASVVYISVAAKSNSTLFNCRWFNRIEHAKLLRSNVSIMLSSIITIHSLDNIDLFQVIKLCVSYYTVLRST